MYHLLKGLHAHLTRKDEYSVVIIGLDNVSGIMLWFTLNLAHESAGRKDGEYGAIPPSDPILQSQTMLEKIKTLYNPTPGMPPDKIGPTIGQNSTSPLPHSC